MKRLGKVLGVVVLLLGIVFVWGFVVPASPDGQWPLDIVQLRKLAASMEGDRPTEVRVEPIAAFEFPEAVQVTGGSFSARAMTCYAYQLVFPTRTALVDTAMDEKTARGGTPVKKYFDDGWKRLQAALPAADFAVVTHEHFDHIGGALVSPDGWAKLIANPQQLEHPELVKPLTYPTAKPKQVVDYQGATAIAPGVVLVRAPGHTPGSQLVFVTLADGSEVLFLGDVAWQMDNVDKVRGRARLLTTFFEDGHAVLQQLAALNALKKAEPKLVMVPGHDSAAVDALISRGVMKTGFVVP